MIVAAGKTMSKIVTQRRELEHIWGATDAVSAWHVRRFKEKKRRQKVLAINVRAGARAGRQDWTCTEM